MQQPSFGYSPPGVYGISQRYDKPRGRVFRRVRSQTSDEFLKRHDAASDSQAVASSTFIHLMNSSTGHVSACKPDLQLPSMPRTCRHRYCLAWQSRWISPENNWGKVVLVSSTNYCAYLVSTITGYAGTYLRIYAYLPPTNASCD